MKSPRIDPKQPVEELGRHPERLAVVSVLLLLANSVLVSVRLDREESRDVTLVGVRERARAVLHETRSKWVPGGVHGRVSTTRGLDLPSDRNNPRETSGWGNENTTENPRGAERFGMPFITTDFRGAPPFAGDYRRTPVSED